jgi:hypothetical protein
MTTTIQTGAQNPKASGLLKKVIERASKIAGEGKQPCPEVLARVKAEVQKINPGLKGLTAFIGCKKWEFDGKPIVPYPTQDTWEGEADQDGLPKDAKLSQQLLEEAKNKCYDAWERMLDDGAFDGESKVESKPVEKEAEEIDMAELARRQKEKEQEKTVDEVVSDKTPEDEEAHEGDEPSLMGISGRPVLEQMETLVQYNKVKGTPPIVPMMNAITQSIAFIQELTKSSGRAQHNDNRLQNAIEDIARGVVGPASDSDLQDRIDRIEAKLDELIDFRRETEGNMNKNLSEVVGDIVREKMKGMFS